MDHFLLLLDSALLGGHLVAQALPFFHVHAVLLGCTQTLFDFVYFLLSTGEICFVFLSLSASFLWLWVATYRAKVGKLLLNLFVIFRLSIQLT
jgi:hypothetical protein